MGREHEGGRKWSRMHTEVYEVPGVLRNVFISELTVKHLELAKPSEGKVHLPKHLAREVCRRE